MDKNKKIPPRKKTVPPALPDRRSDEKMSPARGTLNQETGEIMLPPSSKRRDIKRRTSKKRRQKIRDFLRGEN